MAARPARDVATQFVEELLRVKRAKENIKRLEQELLDGLADGVYRVGAHVLVIQTTRNKRTVSLLETTDIP